MLSLLTLQPLTRLLRSHPLPSGEGSPSLARSPGFLVPHLNPLLRDAVRYFGVSVIALGVDWGGLALCHRVFGWHYLAAATASFLAGLAVAWSLSAAFVFRGRRKLSLAQEFAGFLLTGIAGLVITQAALAALVSGLSLPAEAAKLPVAGVVFAFNFVSRRALLFAPATVAAPAAKTAGVALASIAGFAAALAIFLLTHSASGIVGDAKIYIGRALADLDPAGVGRDTMFRLDGQSGFSAFTPLARALVAHLSPLHAALLLTAASQALWFAALVCLARVLAGARAAWVVALACLLPAGYGPAGLLAFAEPLAVPRPFAEACVLLALAAWLTDRRATAWACVAAASAFHPIMALAGVSTLWLLASRESFGWRFAAAVSAALALFAAVEQWPLADRFFVTVDAEWLALLRARNAYLFPDLWPASAFALVVVQALTLLVGLRGAAPRWRAVALASLGVGFAGLAIAWCAGALWPSVLILQLQVWRAWWLPACLSTLALGALALRARNGNVHDRLVLALVTFAWVSTGAGLAGPIAAAAALWWDRFGAKRWPTMSPRAALIAWGAVGTFVATTWLGALPEIAKLFATWQADFTPRLLQIAFVAAQEPLIVGGVALAVFGAARLASVPLALRLATSGALLAAAVIAWDQTATFDRAVGQGTHQTDLAALTGDDGEILWLTGSNEPWLWLGAPQWNAKIQGAGIVFSRDLATHYEERARFLVENGFDDGDLLGRVHGAISYPRPTPTALHTLCSRDAAPAAVVVPLAPDAEPHAAWRAAVWTAPAPRVEPPLEASGEMFRAQRYAIIRCADHR